MPSKKIKWLIYTVIVGLIPIISRAIIWSLTKSFHIELFSPSDFIAFGLVLHISNINELEHITTIDQSWKTAHNGGSIVFIAIYSVLFSISLLGQNNIESEILLKSAIALSIISTLLSYSIYYRISRIP